MSPVGECVFEKEMDGRNVNHSLVRENHWGLVWFKWIRIKGMFYPPQIKKQNLDIIYSETFLLVRQ
jgi:hypothetical protein